MPRIYTELTGKQEKTLLKILKDSFPEGFFLASDVINMTHKIPTNGVSWRIVLDRLRQKGWIVMLERGKYSFGELLTSQPEDTFTIANHLIKPAAVAYHSALNHYGMTEQVSNKIYVQSTVRKRSKEVLGVRYQFVTVGEKKFFGFRTEWRGQASFMITEPEKTILDCFDLPQYAGGFREALSGFITAHTDLNKEKLWEYADRMGNITVMKRIAYISEILGLKNFKRFQEKTKSRITYSYSILDPHSPLEGKRISRWRLFLNIPEETILDVGREAY